MTKNKKTLLTFFFFTLTGGLLSACLRYELLWDLYNYHFYNGFALLNGRVGYDLAPAFIMSFFNPLLDGIIYLILCAFDKNIFLYSFCTGLFFGVLMYVLYLICRLFFDISVKQGKIALILSLIVGATGFATWFQIGTSTNEIPVAALVLGGVYVLVKQIHSDKKQLSAIFIAGFLFGSAAGLKYTTAIYCLTSGISFLLFRKKISSDPFKALLLFVTGGLSGFLIFNGYWLYLMYKNYENPFFPLFNAFFKSPWFPEINTRDEVHIAGHSVWQSLMIPVEMINHTKKKALVGFCRFTDIRFYLMYMAGALCLCTRLFKIPPPPIIRPQTLFLITFTGTSFLVWLFFFSIIRYTIPIEMLTAILLTLFLQNTAACLSKPVFKKAFAVLCVFIYALLISTPLISEEWKHLRDQTSVLNLPKNFDIQDDTLIYLLNEPVTYLTVELLRKNPNARIIAFSTQLDTTWKIDPHGITGYGKFKEKTAKIIQEHTGPIMTIGHAAFPVFNKLCQPLNAIVVGTDERPLFYFSCTGSKEEISELFPNLYRGIFNGEKTD